MKIQVYQESWEKVSLLWIWALGYSRPAISPCSSHSQMSADPRLGYSFCKSSESHNCPLASVSPPYTGKGLTPGWWGYVDRCVLIVCPVVPSRQELSSDPKCTCSPQSLHTSYLKEKQCHWLIMVRSDNTRKNTVIMSTYFAPALC